MEVGPIIQSTTISMCSNSIARSEAVLNYTFTKSDMGRKLVCLVEHVAYPTGSQNSSVALDVLCKYSLVMYSGTL